MSDYPFTFWMLSKTASYYISHVGPVPLILPALRFIGKISGCVTLILRFFF